MFAPVNVTGLPDRAMVRKAAAFVQDGTLYVATNVRNPTVTAYTLPDDTEPVVYGKTLRVGSVVCTGCGCANPWARATTDSLVALATEAIEL
jgi:hypothetical protein